MGYINTGGDIIIIHWWGYNTCGDILYTGGDIYILYTGGDIGGDIIYTCGDTGGD